MPVMKEGIELGSRNFVYCLPPDDKRGPWLLR